MVNVITNKFRKLDWIKDGFNKPWVSRMYRKDGDARMTHDLRCDICGKWYNYNTTDIQKIIAQGRWNFKLNRPFHCGNSMCKDYHEREMLYKMSCVQKMLRGEYVERKVL